MKARCLILSAAAAFAAIGAFTPQPAAAIEYPWCAQYSERYGGGATNCGFVTYAQCMATVSGIGGYCAHNLLYHERASTAHSRKSGG